MGLSGNATPLARLFDLGGRVAVVTGGAGPLGSVLSATLAEAGATVVVVDLDETAVAGAATALREAHGGEHVGLAADLGDMAAVDGVAPWVVERLGRLDVLVNNAALTGTAGVAGYAVPFEEQTPEAFEAATRVNLVAPFRLAQAAAPHLAAHGTGSVVNVSSIYGLVGPNMGLYAGTRMGNPAAYGATKAGLAQLTRYLATVLAPRVRVNAIAPGGIARGQDPAFVARYEALTPLGRMAREDDLRGALAWLASDASAYVTGQVIAVDGGWTAW
jgi:NAD(P)-dependent dehydrogenase (short-subunit alcohol dehydrogenase family)